MNTHKERTRPAPDQGVAMRAVVHWTEALHGGCALGEALSWLLRAVDAEIAKLVRLPSSSDPVEIAQSDRRAGQLPDRPLSISASSIVLDSQTSRARVGSVWFFSEALQESTDPERAASLAREMAFRHICEVVVVVLECRKGESDFLELYLTRVVSDEFRHKVCSITATLCEAWARRKPGIVARSISGLSATGASTIPAILGAGNPAGLSRAEYRVCVLMAAGWTARAIAEKLGVSEATVRSHLRNIYAKTGTTGQCDLVRRILSPGSVLGYDVAADPPDAPDGQHFRVAVGGR